MKHRRLAVVSTFLLPLLLGQAVWAGAPPAIKSAVSRLSQGGHTFDVALPLSGPSGIEPRSTADGLTLVITFDQSVKSGKVAVGSGKATVKGTPSFSGKSMTVKLAGVGDAQEITLKLGNIADGGAALSTTLKFRVLEGDVNGDGVVDEKDVDLAKKHLGNVNGTDFRADVNGSGVIRASDINQIKADIGHRVNGGGTKNTPPVINHISNQKLVSGRTPPGIGVAVQDASVAPEAITVVATSDNPAVVPAENVVVSGDGAACPDRNAGAGCQWIGECYRDRQRWDCQFIPDVYRQCPGSSDAFCRESPANRQQLSSRIRPGDGAA